MNVLIPSSASQEIRIVPRDYATGSNFTVIIIEDGSGKKQTITGVTGVLDGNYFKLTVTFTILVLNSTYFLEVQSGDGSVIYKGKAFCTRRTDKRYKASLNTGRYTEHTSNALNQKYIIVDGGSTDEKPIGGGGEGGVVICHDGGAMSAATSAFQVCSLYCVTVDGTTYDDWYVPARGEVEAFLADFPKITNNQLEGYGYDRIPEGVVNQNPFSVDFKNIWTSTELSQSSSYMWRMPLYGNNIVSEQKNTPEIQADLPFVVRPFRFQEKGNSSAISGDKFGGGVIATEYTLNGVLGYLIISPTQPKLNEHIFWSDLGQTVTGATSETDGAANSAIVLALET